MGNCQNECNKYRDKYMYLITNWVTIYFMLVKLNIKIFNLSLFNH